MQTRTWAVAALAALVGCSGSKNDAKLSIHGELQSSLQATQAAPLHLAMAWYPTFASASPASKAGGIVTQDVTFEGSFPLAFTFEIAGPPPEAALFDLSQQGGSGHLAYGVLIAYEDANGNAKLDTIPKGGAPVDNIVGISMPDPSRPPPAHSYYVLYLDGALAPDDPAAPFALPQGYTLLQVQYHYGIKPVPMDTVVEVPVTRSPGLNLYACPSAFDNVGWLQAACGIDPYNGGHQADAEIYSFAGRGMIQAWVNGGSGIVSAATVTFDGQAVDYDPASEGWFDNPATDLTGVHTVTFTVPGAGTDTVSFTMPPTPVVTAPGTGQQLKKGQSVSIAWEPVPGATYYDLYFLTSEDTPRWVFHAITTDTSVATPAINYLGGARLSVIALAPVATGTQNTFVTFNSRTTVNVTFVP